MFRLFTGGNIALDFIHEQTGMYFEYEYPGNPRRVVADTELRRYFARNEVRIGDPVPDLTLGFTLNWLHTTKFTVPYGIWITNRDLDYEAADLYVFNTLEDLTNFIRGILTMCQAFNVSYSQVILFKPLAYHREQTPEMTYYNIGGFDLPFLPSMDDTLETINGAESRSTDIFTR